MKLSPHDAHRKQIFKIARNRIHFKKFQKGVWKRRVMIDQSGNINEDLPSSLHNYQERRKEPDWKCDIKTLPTWRQHENLEQQIVRETLWGENQRQCLIQQVSLLKLSSSKSVDPFWKGPPAKALELNSRAVARGVRWGDRLRGVWGTEMDSCVMVLDSLGQTRCSVAFSWHCDMWWVAPHLPIGCPFYQASPLVSPELIWF